jgi:hypothetical protein
MSYCAAIHACAGFVQLLLNFLGDRLVPITLHLHIGQQQHPGTGNAADIVLQSHYAQ